MFDRWSKVTNLLQLSLILSLLRGVILIAKSGSMGKVSYSELEASGSNPLSAQSGFKIQSHYRAPGVLRAK